VLGSADFGGALLKRVHVWRIDPLESSESSGLFFNAFVEDPQVKPDEWSVQSYQELRRLIRMTVPEGWARDEALSRIAILDPRRRLGLEEKGEATTWLYLAHSYPSPRSLPRAAQRSFARDRLHRGWRTIRYTGFASSIDAALWSEP